MYLDEKKMQYNDDVQENKFIDIVAVVVGDEDVLREFPSRR
jgi:hypothetical protein